MRRVLWLSGFTLALAACGPDASGEVEPADNEAATTNETVSAAGTEKALPPCPFRNTGEWRGSNEGGRLLVTGTVDLQMAGMKPALTERSDSPPGTIAFDLAITPETGAAVTPEVRYEKSGSPRYARGEIHCGGERIATFDMVNI